MDRFPISAMFSLCIIRPICRANRR